MNEVASPAARTSAPPRTMPVLSVNVKLHTEFAQRVYKRCFDRLKGDLYVLTVRTHAGGMDEAAQAIETVLTETFASVRKDLDSEMERSDILLDSVKLNELAEYGVASIKATYSTPRAKEFLDLLIKMDQLLMRYDSLWLTGNIESRQRWTRCQNWQRRMTKVANRLRELGNRTRSGLTKEAEKRAAGLAVARLPTQANDSSAQSAVSDDGSVESSPNIGTTDEEQTAATEETSDGAVDEMDITDAADDDSLQAFDDAADELVESDWQQQRLDTQGTTPQESSAEHEPSAAKVSTVRRRRVVAQAGE